MVQEFEFPPKAFRDWNMIEPVVVAGLHQALADQGMTLHVTARMKEHYTNLCEAMGNGHDQHLELPFPPATPREREAHASAIQGAFATNTAFWNAVISKVTGTAIARLLELEIRLYRAEYRPQLASE